MAGQILVQLALHFALGLVTQLLPQIAEHARRGDDDDLAQFAGLGGGVDPLGDRASEMLFLQLVPIGVLDGAARRARRAIGGL